MKNKLSKHGSSRYIERFNIGKREQLKDFKYAVEKGIPPLNLKDGELKKFLQARESKKVKIKYYKERAYIYKKTNERNILITVIDVSRFNKKGVGSNESDNK